MRLAAQSRHVNGSRRSISSPRLTAAERRLRLAVAIAICSGRSARSVKVEFRYAALSLGSRVAVWLDDEIQRLTGESVR